jgi:hypothetical protein
MQKLGRFPCEGDEIRVWNGILRVEALNGTKIGKGSVTAEKLAGGVSSRFFRKQRRKKRHTDPAAPPPLTEYQNC